MSYLLDHKIVDLNFSKLVIDEKITKLQKDGNKTKLAATKKEKKRQLASGEIEFIDKVFVNYLGSKQARPPYFFTWCRYEKANGYRELTAWRAKWKYTPVNMDEDNYCADGLAPNAEGNYTYGDLILVKCPLLDHLKRRQLEVNMSKGGAKSKLLKFHSDMGREGSAIPDDEMEKMLGELL